MRVTSRAAAFRAVLAGVAVLLLAACGSGAAPPAAAPPAGAPPAPVGVADGPLARDLTAGVSADAAFAHLEALQRVADENGGNRATGTPGYDASVEYVVGRLRGLGFEVGTPTYEADGASGRNVIAQTRTGDPGRVVVIGAHLDSVEEGPGVVDNGSGVAALLEIAARLGPEPQVRNAVRFAFFDAEEDGAVGSQAYVEGLSADELERIELYLNVDMVASSNGGYLVQGGVGGDEGAAGPPGSATVAGVLVDQLTKAGVTAPEIIEFVGDDESPFIEAGIPVGGAENGDARDKTAEQARKWGGRPGQVYDPCYHQACDRVDNVDREVLGHYLRALAGTLAHFATSPDALR